MVFDQISGLWRSLLDGNRARNRWFLMALCWNFGLWGHSWWRCAEMAVEVDPPEGQNRRFWCDLGVQKLLSGGCVFDAQVLLILHAMLEGCACRRPDLTKSTLNHVFWPLFGPKTRFYKSLFDYVGDEISSDHKWIFLAPERDLLVY